MWLFSFSLLCYIFTLIDGEVYNVLNNKLKKWHKLKQDDIVLVRNRRSVNDGHSVLPLDQEISFDAFDRTFTLSLIPSPEVFSSTFKAFVESRQETRELFVDKATIMTGKVLGDSKSQVTAHLNGKMLTANIFTNNETYVVEPIWRHLSKQQHSSNSEKKISRHIDFNDMLVYRHSDLNLSHLQVPHSKTGFCGTDHLKSELHKKQVKQINVTKHSFGSSEHSKYGDSFHHRQKRTSGTGSMKKICQLTLVADHRFYKEMGNNSALETMYYLINLIERVNKIFKETDWGSESDTAFPGQYAGYGFQIGEIKIHNESTATPRYNSLQHEGWEVEDLLEAFSKKKLSDCLSHLFTYDSFKGGVLGLAYISSDRLDNEGGICSAGSDKGADGQMLYHNTGLTSTAYMGQRILTTEADLVTAHELGHNFGAQHDIVDDGATTEAETHNSCAPGQSHNGNYIMYQNAVSGQYPNNKKFSACSKHNILLRLKKKAHICFREDRKSFCGNYQVEAHGNEECDVGYLTAEDRCCTSDCKLKKGAQCSNKNYPCCTDDCRVAKPTKLCMAQIPGLCFKNVYCDGVGFKCPKPDPVPDNSSCGDLGKCRNGHCLQFCRTKNLQPCLCSGKDEYCLRCCAPLNVTGDKMIRNCKPYSEDSDEEIWPQHLPENSTCQLGYCSKNKCQAYTQDAIAMVWDLFQYIAPDKIGDFMARNIVGAVLIFSLLFWIPCSCLVNFIDKKRLKKQKESLIEKSGDFSRSFGFRGVAGGSAPATPRIRIHLNNMNWASAGVARPDFDVYHQTTVFKEQEMVIHESDDSLDGNEFLPAATRDDDNAASFERPLLAHSPNDTKEAKLFARPDVVSCSKSYAPIASESLPTSSDELFDGDVKPMAASSLADLSVEGVVETSTKQNPNDSFVVFRRPLASGQKDATFLE